MSNFSFCGYQIPPIPVSGFNIARGLGKRIRAKAFRKSKMRKMMAKDGWNTSFSTKNPNFSRGKLSRSSNSRLQFTLRQQETKPQLKNQAVAQFWT